MNSPVSVVGLSSGVTSVALGGVRFQRVGCSDMCCEGMEGVGGG